MGAVIELARTLGFHKFTIDAQLEPSRWLLGGPIKRLWQHTALWTRRGFVLEYINDTAIIPATSEPVNERLWFWITLKFDEKLRFAYTLLGERLVFVVRDAYESTLRMVWGWIRWMSTLFFCNFVRRNSWKLEIQMEMFLSGFFVIFGLFDEITWTLIIME